MATVKAKFRPLTSDSSQGKIYLQVIHERQVRTISTKYIVHAQDWNSRKGIFAVPSTSARSEEINRIRLSLFDEIRCIKAIINKIEMTNISYTATDIIEEYKSHVNRFSLFNFMSTKISNLRTNGKLRTAQNYNSTLRSFKAFRQGEDIIIDNITPEIIEHYEYYLQARHLKPNTTSFYMRILRAVCNNAAESGALIQTLHFRHVYTGIEKTQKRALPLTAMKKLYSMNLTASPNLEYARDIFILSFLTRGMSFIDMAFVLKTDFRNGYLTYRRHKTGQTLSIKWTPEMQFIVDKYSPNPTKYFFPILCNPKSNPIYAYRNISYKINRGLRQLSSIIGLTSYFTLYSARHTWASIARLKGIPISVISQGMGHDSERTTQIYLASIDSSAIDRANIRVINSIF